MYLCYIDESGFCEKGYDSGQPIQVMAGIFPNLYNYHKSDIECKNFLKSINVKIPVREIKAKDLYRGSGKWNGVPGEIRKKIIDFYLNWLIERKHKVIISAIDNKKFFDIKKNPKTNIVKTIKHPYILGGLHIALVIQSINRTKKENKGKTLLIFDEQYKYQSSLSEIIYEPPTFIDEFVTFEMKKDGRRLNQIIDTAFFVKSHHSTMAQVADLIAYLFRLYLLLNHYGKNEDFTGQKLEIDTWMKKIMKNFIIKYKKSKSPFLDFLNGTKSAGI